MDALSKFILDYKNIETGGQLFGHWTFDGKPVVEYVLGPGPNAGHHNAFFMQDLGYLKSCAAILKQKYGLDHIGEWHSHHQLGLAHPSGHDARNMATNTRRLGYAKFLLCIGTCTNVSSSINAFMFSSDSEDYIHVPWAIKDIDSPYRKFIETGEYANQFISPRTRKANMTDLLIIGQGAKTEPTKVSFNKSYWLQIKENRMILKNIIEFLSADNPMLTCSPTIDSNQEVHLEIYQGIYLMKDVFFPKDFPIEPPVITDAYGNSLYPASSWDFNGDIYYSFRTYYNTNNSTL